MQIQIFAGWPVETAWKPTEAEPEHECSFDEFLHENEDCYSAQEIADMRAVLLRGDDCLIGGGAQPEFTLRCVAGA